MILKLKYLFALAAMAMLVACDPENNVEPGGGGGTEDPTRPVYTAKLTDLHNPTIQRKWEKGDKIAVFNTVGMEEYVFEGEDGSLSGTIKATGNGGPSGDALEKVLAVYPASAAQYIDTEGSIRIRFDDSALIGHETEASIWVASADPSSGTLEFKCITSYLEIPVYGKGDISTIQFMSPEKITGPATVTLSGNVPECEMVYKTQDEYFSSWTMKLSAPAGQSLNVENEQESARKILVPLPAIQYRTGLTFEINGTSGKACGMIKSLSSLNSNELLTVEPVAVEFFKEYPETTPVPLTDDGFKAYCLDVYDRNMDGVFTFGEAETVPVFDFWDGTGVPYRDKVKSIDDLQYFPNVFILEMKDMNIKSLKFRNNPGLGQLCAINMPNLESIDFRGAPYIGILILQECGLSSLDVSSLPLLYNLYCSKNELKELDLSSTGRLTNLGCGYNQLTILDVRNKPLLEELYCHSNHLKELDLSENPNLMKLDCGNNEITSLDLSHNPKLERLDCYSNEISSLDLSALPELKDLNCASNALTSLDLSALPELKDLNCASNALTSLDLSKTPKLRTVWCRNNPLSSLDISKLPELEYIDCSESQLERLNLGQNDNLKELHCAYNKLTSLDLSKTPKLERLSCYYNRLNILDVTGSPELLVLDCVENQLESLNLSQCSKLFSLNCVSNHITSLDVSKNDKLESLWCALNPLKSLDVSALQELEDLRCWGNEFTSLDVSNNTKLTYLDCRSDYLKELWLKKGQVIPELYYNPEVTEIKYKD